MDLNLVLYSVFGPFLVWGVEYFLPYPYIIEELFKTILVYFFPQKSFKTYIYAGISFALTETVLYSFNVNAFGSIGLLFTRLLSTSLLHSFTFLIIYWSTKKDRRLIVVGFVISVLIHFLYNKYIPAY